MQGWNHTSLCWRVPFLESRSSTTWWKKSLNCWVVWRRSWNIWMIEAGTQTKNKNSDFLKVFLGGSFWRIVWFQTMKESDRGWLLVMFVFLFFACCCCCRWLDILFWRQEPYGFGCLVRVWMLDISWMYAIMGWKRAAVHSANWAGCFFFVAGTLSCCETLWFCGPWNSRSKGRKKFFFLGGLLQDRT